MKKFLLCGFCICLLAGCGGDRPVMGTIRIVFPSVPRVIDKTSAENNSNYYEAVIYNSGYSLCIDSTQAGTGEVFELSIEPGTYNVIVLAGHNGSYSYDYPVMLGTGWAQDVAVNAGEVTEVPITLTNIELSVSVPEEVVCGAAFSIGVEGDSICPLLRPSFNGTTDEEKLRVMIDDDDYVMTVSENGTGFTASVDLTAPLLPDDATVKVLGGYMRLVDPASGIDTLMHTYTSERWYWMNADEIPDGNPLLDEVVFPLSFVTSGTGVNLTIDW